MRLSRFALKPARVSSQAFGGNGIGAATVAETNEERSRPKNSIIVVVAGVCVGIGGAVLWHNNNNNNNDNKGEQECLSCLVGLPWLFVPVWICCCIRSSCFCAIRGSEKILDRIFGGSPTSVAAKQRPDESREHTRWKQICRGYI